MKRYCGVLAVFACLTLCARAEDIKVMTYNIELFNDHFAAHHATTQPIIKENKDDPTIKDIMAELQRKNDEDNWEAAQVILDPKLSPDVLVLQEGCIQPDLEYFNKRWLNSAYETVIVLPTNTTRNQTLCMLLKPGFKILEKKDQYYLEPDSVPNERGDRLFARGPSFCLIESPGGYKFWVGTNHEKSKSGNNVEVTKWRNREAKRVHELMTEISQKGAVDMVFLGDMNDEVGFQEYEQEAGGDSLAILQGAPDDGIILATKPLVDAGKISYGGYWKTEHRSFIDHIFVSKSLQPHVEEVGVFQDGFAKVASDHYPVYMRLKTSR